jgi:hypothetical protein
VWIQHWEYERAHGALANLQVCVFGCETVL